MIKITQLIAEQSTDLRAAVADYVEAYDFWTYNFGESGEELERQMETLKQEITKQKGEEYFKKVDHLAQLVGDSYSKTGWTKDDAAALAKVLNDLGFSREELRIAYTTDPEEIDRQEKIYAKGAEQAKRMQIPKKPKTNTMKKQMNEQIVALQKIAGITMQEDYQEEGTGTVEPTLPVGMPKEEDSTGEGRMDGLVNQKALEAFLKAARVITKELQDDGFDEEDVYKYLQAHLYKATMYDSQQ